MEASQENAVRIGPAGWSYEDWKGTVYPLDMPKSLHPLEFLSDYFDTVEINSTFYRPPNPRYCSGWLKKVAGNPRFKFTLKLWERFTHQRKTWPDSSETQTFMKGIEPLAASGRLGALLIQFPWSFKRTPDNRKWLGRVLDTFAAYPLALEVRHASWNRPEVFTALAERQVAFCNIDQPLFGGSLHPTDKVTAKVGYVRLHGRNAADWFREDAGRDDRYNYLYSEEELRPWIEKIERIRAMADEVYVITNNHYQGQAVVNAFELQRGLGSFCGRVPRHLATVYPRLSRLLES